MAAGFCPKLIQFCRVRIARLESNGVPDPGAGNLYISSNQVSLGITMNLEAGDDFVQKNGCGDICYSFKSRDQVKNLTLTYSSCDHDPEFIQLMQGGSLLQVLTATVGYKLPPVGSVGNENGVSMEGWVKNISGSGIDADFPYVRFVLPKTFWTPSDKTLENNPIVSSFTGEGQENANIYDGPANDIDFDIDDTLLAFFGDTSLPTAQCEAIALAAS